MYSQIQVQKLIDYYSDKVIGKPMDVKFPEILIEKIIIIDFSNNTSNLFCKNISSNPDIQIPLKSVAKNLDLLTPLEVLNNQSPAKN